MSAAFAHRLDDIAWLAPSVAHVVLAGEPPATPGGPPDGATHRWSAFTDRGEAPVAPSGGIWVSPAEVESVLVAHPDVLEAAVVGGRDAQGLEITVAYLVPRASRSIDAAAIEAHCREHMAAFKRPRRLVVADELPRTATGKIQRYRLRGRETGATG
ncbi:MAG TPA: hypothetical protein VK858_20230 [Longimicrobiales bacterium]|nr:hypothetical protein [Longimicrobiales bacterium]